MDYFSIRAAEAERTFLSRIKDAAAFFFRTGGGRVNTITAVTDDAVYFKSAKAKRPARISRTKLRQALRFVYWRRTATREDMEDFHHFNSALLGLVAAVLVGSIKIQRTVRGLLRLTFFGTRYFFSGCDRDPTAMRIAKENGALMLLMSYFWLMQYKTEKWLKHLRAAGFIGDEEEKILILDSGAKSIYELEEANKRLPAGEQKVIERINIQKYISFIRKYRKYLWGWFSLDVIGDAAATRRNYEEMCAEGVPPIPVWGITDDVRDLDRYVESDQELIAIGGVAILLRRRQIRKAAELLRSVFRRHPGQNFHIFGCGIIRMLKELMPFSADSSGPVTVGGKGRVITEEGQTYAPPGWSKNDCTAESVRNMMLLENWMPPRAEQLTAF